MPNDFRIPSRPNRNLQGKVAIVTGAGSRGEGIGNGRACVILLAEAGVKIICADLNLGWAQVTVDMITREFGSGKAIAVQADVSKATDCKMVVDKALEAFGRLDILVNNVGIAGPPGTAIDVDHEQWTKAMEVNVTSMMLMAKYAVPAMERNEKHEISGKGSIINMSSVSGMFGGNAMLLYPTSKGAILNMTRAMAVHHGTSGIRVNSVCPGMLFTPMVYNEGMSEATREARRQGSLLKTEGNSWDAGLAVRFLASDEARWITGAMLPVDAGYSAAPGGGSGSNAEIVVKAPVVRSKL